MLSGLLYRVETLEISLTMPTNRSLVTFIERDNLHTLEENTNCKEIPILVKSSFEKNIKLVLIECQSMVILKWVLFSIALIKI